MHIIVTALLLALLLIILHLHKDTFFNNSQENMAVLGSSDFNSSMIDVYRAQLKNKLGMNVNDYVLESSLMTGIGLPKRGVRIL